MKQARMNGLFSVAVVVLSGDVELKSEMFSFGVLGSHSALYSQ
jgi:hypothetical protein